MIQLKPNLNQLACFFPSINYHFITQVEDHWKWDKNQLHY